MNEIADQSLHENTYIHKIGLQRFEALFESSYIVDRLVSTTAETNAVKADRTTLLHMAANARYGQLGGLHQALKERKSMAEIREIYRSYGLNEGEVVP